MPPEVKAFALGGRLHEDETQEPARRPDNRQPDEHEGKYERRRKYLSKLERAFAAVAASREERRSVSWVLYEEEVRSAIVSCLAVGRSSFAQGWYDGPVPSTQEVMRLAETQIRESLGDSRYETFAHELDVRLTMPFWVFELSAEDLELVHGACPRFYRPDR